jgi:predicted peptidase
MKKLLLLLFLIPLVSFGQMTITNHVQDDFFGGKLDYKTYMPKVKSTKWLVFLPGTGELGNNDGTLLYLLDKYGYMKLAANGYEFPFNILAIQPSTSYSSVSKALLPWVNEEFKPSAIILIGISLGAIATNDLLGKDRYHLIKAVVPLSGKASSLTSIPKMVSVPGYAWHGMDDVTVKYSEAMAFYNAYNKYQTDNNLPGGFFIKSVPGVAHSGWDQAMSVTPGEDDILQFILQKFGPEPQEAPCICTQQSDTVRIKIIVDKPYLIQN